jgi:CheY-like chemotaxis protein
MSRGLDKEWVPLIYLAEPSGEIAEQISQWQRHLGGKVEIQSFRSSRQLLRRLDYRQPDLLLLDVEMPRFDGLTAVRTLQSRQIPVILLSPNTSEGALVTISALQAGASDYLVLKNREQGRCITSGRNRFSSVVNRALGRNRPAWNPPTRISGWPAGQLPLSGRGRDGNDWTRLEIGNHGVEVCGLVSSPFPKNKNWIGITLAHAHSLGRMLTALSAAPSRPGRGMLFHIPQSQKFSRAVSNAAERCWNHPVLQLHAREPMMTGQWRFIPGRHAIGSLVLTADRAHFDLVPNRSTDADRAIGFQLEQLTALEPGLLRIYLCDLPGPALLPAITKLIENDQIVLLHRKALEAAWGKCELTRETDAGVASGPWLLEKTPGRMS